MLELNRIYQGDCLDLMREMPDKCVDLTVTSPPYDNLREYKGYAFDFEGIAKELFRVTKDGGVVVWVVGDATINGSETGTSFKQALYFKEIGFNLHDTMIYQKNCYPFPPSNRYFGVFEYMFILSKFSPKTFTPIMVQTKNRGDDRFRTNRQPDGSIARQEYACGKYSRIKENVWKYEVGFGKSTPDEIAYEHPAIFPDALVNDHILSWSNEGDTVLDPFLGSGTTAVSCKKLGRNFIGIEKEPAYITIAEKRLEKVNNHKITDFFGVSE